MSSPSYTDTHSYLSSDDVLTQDPDAPFPGGEEKKTASLTNKTGPASLKRTDGDLLPQGGAKYKPKKHKSIKIEPAATISAKKPATKFNRYDLFKEFVEQMSTPAVLKSVQTLFTKFEEKEVEEFKSKLASGEAHLDEQIVHFGKYKGQRYIDLWNDTTPSDEHGSCGRSYLNYCKKLGILYGQSVAIVEVMQENESRSK